MAGVEDFFQQCDKNVITNFKVWARLFKAELRKPRVSEKFEFRDMKAKKNKFRLILFVYNLVIECSVKNRKRFSKKMFLDITRRILD